MAMERGRGRGRSRGRGGGRGLRTPSKNADGDNPSQERWSKNANTGRGGNLNKVDAENPEEEWFKTPNSGRGFSHRGQVDPETQQYFSEINNLVGENGTVEDEEERAMVIANALDEARGKELQLACNASCGRVLETLLLSSSTEHVALFLERCTEVFASMALDPGGSHVAEAALKSVAFAVQGSNVRNQEWYPTVERSLSKICQAVGEGENGSDVISSRYGSHVLRQLLSLCSGVPLETGSGGKAPNSLAERLGTKTSKFRGAGAPRPRGHRFPDQLHLLVEKLLESCQETIAELRAGSAGGPALQFMLRALEGDEATVTHAIALMLECPQELEVIEGSVLENASVEKVVEMIQNSSSSHLMEVMLQVASDALYLEIFQRFFRYRLLQFSVHPSANFVIQALIASARHPGQVAMMLEELENSFSEILAERRGTVAGALLAACLRFRIKQREVCRALTRAINPDMPSPNCIVPRMLFLEGLFGSGKFPQEWKAPFGSRMSVLGCAMLQTAFSYPQECCQQFCASMAALESNDILEAVRDPGGSRVVEAFLTTVAAPMKHKHRLIAKLKGQFAELALSPICSYTVEKCFATGDVKLKEMIAAELALSQPEISKTRHGPYLLKRCDIATYAKGPEQWRMHESSKQGTRAAYAGIFQTEEEDHYPAPEPATTSTGSEGKKKRKADENSHLDFPPVEGSEPPSISALELGGTMAQLGFSVSKFPHGNKKTKVGKIPQPEASSFEPEEGQRVKQDEIDSLFKEKKADRTEKRQKDEKKEKRKKDEKKEKHKGRGEIAIVSANVGSSTIDDSLKAVMGVLEGSLKKSKKKREEGSATKKQKVMI